MELQVKAYHPFGTMGQKLYVGDLIFKKGKIVAFKEGANSEMLKDFSKSGTFPIYREEFYVEYIDKYHNEYGLFDAKITIKNKISFGIILTKKEKIKLEIIMRYSWFNNYENQWKIFIFVVMAVIAIIAIIYKKQ